MQLDKKLSLWGGIFVFAISFIVYVLTLEPTASFWDCGEFISCAYKLEVPHPPGAPFFLLLGRAFSLFAGNNTEQIAFWVNMLSAFGSALTIMFLFWTIKWFAQKLSKTDNKVLIHGAALIGSLAYAFTDSFWFSAVEGEVYATSSLLTAIVFWAILKWEEEFESPRSIRWILLIFFLLGASIGIHLLNLLAIPAIAFVIYSKNQKKSPKNGILTLVLSFLILGVIVFGFIPGIAKLGSAFDLLFVNKFSLPVNSGLLFTMLLLGVILVFLIKRAINKKQHLLYMASWAFIMMLLGFSSYSIVVIRSNQDTPINMSKPDNPFSLLHYLNREQYGSRSLIYGPYYNADVSELTQRHSYEPLNGKYEKDKLNPKVKYDDAHCSIFPRMSSSAQDHIEAYKRWGNIKNESKPTFANNLTFFFRYQVGHMYFRYLMWNFAGRQNDIQGFGETYHGNWISGINFIDSMRLGSQQDLPDNLKNNRGRNTYFFLPLLLGIIGAVFQYKKNRDGFLVTLLLFFFTGLAIVVYLNEIPITPRERDYVYVGSFYAFAIWIGISVFPIFGYLNKKLKANTAQWITLIFCFAGAPALLIWQNWDDHSRANRYVAREVAKNYLQSCDTNAILFTTADNDTYPLWYAQEVEGYRTDIRQALLPYFSANWYVEGASKDKPETPRLPIRFTQDKLINGQRDATYIIEKTKNALDANQILDFIYSDNPKSKVLLKNGDSTNYIPTRKLKIPVDKNNFLSSIENKQSVPDSIQNFLEITISGSGLYKSDLIVLDIITNNNWERPIYFVNTVVPQNLGLADHLLREGLAYRLVPYKVKPENYNVEKNYDLLMNRYNWGNLNAPKVYLDNTITRTAGMVLGLRKMYTDLAQQLVLDGKTEEAKKVLDKAEEEIPYSKVPLTFFDFDKINVLLALNEKEKAEEFFKKIVENQKQYLDYFSELKNDDKALAFDDVRRSLYTLQRLTAISKQFGNDYFNELDGLLKTYFNEFAEFLS